MSSSTTGNLIYTFIMSNLALINKLFSCVLYSTVYETTFTIVAIQLPDTGGSIERSAAQPPVGKRRSCAILDFVIEPTWKYPL